MERRTLGKTGLSVSVLGVGGYHVGVARDVELGTRIVRTAINEGINFLDNAWCYNSGVSESIMGTALRDGYREKAVLMTKNHGRDTVTFRSQLEDSLRRLKTDCIDLLQLHEIVDEGIPVKIRDNGVLEAAARAREKGLVRFIGFTGHRHPHLLKEMLDLDFDWDTVQLPTNLLDVHYRSFQAEIIPLLNSRDIGVIGMKSLAGDGTSMFKTGVSAREALTFAISLPIHTLVSGMDTVELVKENCRIVREFGGYSDSERQALADRVAPFAGDGALETYKSAE